jgi:hypothetical protein
MIFQYTPSIIGVRGGGGARGQPKIQANFEIKTLGARLLKSPVSGNLDVLNVQNFIARRLVIFPTLNFGQKSFSPPECCSYAYADHCAILWAQNNVEAFKSL